MSKSKILGIMALVAFAMGIMLARDVVAGEKHQFRIVQHIIKWNPVNVPDEEGHVIGSYDSQGITTNLGGKEFFNGWLYYSVGSSEVNPKIDAGSGYGYSIVTDGDGDKIYTRWENKKVKGEPRNRGTSIIIKGTGKWEGIQGSATYVSTAVAPGEFYTDGEWDIEVPRR